MNDFFKGLLSAALQGAAKTVVGTEGSNIDPKQTGIAAAVGAGIAGLMYLLSHPSTTPEVRAAVSTFAVRALSAAAAE